MQKVPKGKSSEEVTAEKPAETKPPVGDDSSWSSDQKKRDYYYDDTCGYEVYDPKKEDEKED